MLKARARARSHRIWQFHEDLACFPAEALAVYLRGRPVSGSDELIDLLRFRSPEQFHHEVEKAPPVSEAVASMLKAWLERIIASFSAEEIESFLVFSTGKRTISASRQGGSRAPIEPAASRRASAA